MENSGAEFQELESALLAAGVPPESVSVLQRNARPPGSPGGNLSLEALLATEGHTPGTKKIRSLRLRHWLVNWRAILLDALPSGLSAASGTHSLARVAGLLKCLKALAEATSVELGDREANLVVQLWSRPEQVLSKKEIEQASGLSSPEFEAAVDALLQVGAIEVEEDERVIKTEWIIYV